MKKKQPCPICGNEIEPIKTGNNMFRCKYCRRLIEVTERQKKGKVFLEMSEKI
jgi:tRNA(Ile2) C34 agmatinyltransferase TiaS